MWTLLLTLALADEAPKAPIWPEAGAPLHLLPLRPAVGRRPKVMISAGHGAGSNQGNVGAHGQLEEETTLEVALYLVEQLEQLDRFDLILARDGSSRPSYQRRVARAEALGVDVIVELHTDVRGGIEVWAYNAERPIYRTSDSPGFSVLYRDRGPIAEERASLARTVASSLSAAGFPAYDGRNYTGLFDIDPTPGAFQDRRRLYMLRTPTMPSIIVEMHNAVDPEESLRWREERVQRAFALSMADALTRYLYPSTDAPAEDGAL